MKLMTVESKNHVFTNIATMRDMRVNMDVLASDSEKFVKALDSYREDIVINNSELRVAELLDESFIMSGKFDNKLIEAMQKIGATTETFNAFKTLGFSSETPEFHELNRFMYNGYSALRNVIKKVYDEATTAIAENDETKEVYLDMYRKGILTSAEQFLNIGKYFTINNITPQINSEGTSYDQDFITSHTERYSEWLDQTIEQVLINLFETPLEPSYVAPIGLESLVESMKGVSEKLADVFTEFGSKEPSITSIRRPEFMEVVKTLSAEERQTLMNAINTFSAANVCGSIAVNGNNVPVPSAVSIIDVIIGFVLHVGEVIVSYAEVVKDGSEEELIASIESEEVRVFIDLLVDELREYPNANEIALNMISLVFRYIPMYIFSNPSLRMTQIPELNELNANIYGIYFGMEGDDVNE